MGGGDAGSGGSGIDVTGGMGAGMGAGGDTKPRNPRHFDGIKGGRKRASDTSLIRNSV